MKHLFLFLFLALFSTYSLAITKAKLDFVVGVDGNFKQAMDAAKSANPTSQKRFYIFFPNGQYDIGSLTGDANQKPPSPLLTFLLLDKIPIAPLFSINRRVKALVFLQRSIFIIQIICIYKI